MDCSVVLVPEQERGGATQPASVRVFQVSLSMQLSRDRLLQAFIPRTPTILVPLTVNCDVRFAGIRAKNSSAHNETSVTSFDTGSWNHGVHVVSAFAIVLFHRVRRV